MHAPAQLAYGGKLITNLALPSIGCVRSRHSWMHERRPLKRVSSSHVLFENVQSRGHKKSRTKSSAHASSTEKPQWVKDMEEDAENDEDIAQIIAGTGGDPELIRERIRVSMLQKDAEIQSGRLGNYGKGGAGALGGSSSRGTPEIMNVRFREVNPFKLWIWFELYNEGSSGESDLLSEVMKSWFLIGRLGGFNGMNLQVFNAGGEDTSYMEYQTQDLDTGVASFFHDMGEMEMKGEWCRCWVNMGTADELALDVLINSLSTFSIENMGIKQLVIGGENADWPVPEERPMQTSIDPMRINKHIDPEDY